MTRIRYHLQTFYNNLDTLTWTDKIVRLKRNVKIPQNHHHNISATKRTWIKSKSIWVQPIRQYLILSIAVFKSFIYRCSNIHWVFLLSPPHVPNLNCFVQRRVFAHRRFRKLSWFIKNKNIFWRHSCLSTVTGFCIESTTSKPSVAVIRKRSSWAPMTAET